ncbi:ABC transporter ATP-binding protein [Rhodobacteraceae bacterium F11138]|nr:ABC transporter ATP-binding protein [Rhodobacteraceae bacterium F11138]
MTDEIGAENPLLRVENVSKTYGSPGENRPVLDGVSLDLRLGETLALTGESGSGKSTLLHLVGALDDFDAGEIRLGATNLSGLTDRDRAALRRTQVAMVFQQFNLIASLTVAENLRVHARLAGREDQSWLIRLTERLGLTDLLARYPEHLSGGQQQRVAIGRALAMRPRLLLADEPTGNLDEHSSAKVMDLMLELVRDAGSALFLVTHSNAIADQLDRRLHLRNGHVA